MICSHFIDFMGKLRGGWVGRVRSGGLDMGGDRVERECWERQLELGDM